MYGAPLASWVICIHSARCSRIASESTNRTPARPSGLVSLRLFVCQVPALHTTATLSSDSLTTSSPASQSLPLTRAAKNPPACLAQACLTGEIRSLAPAPASLGQSDLLLLRGCWMLQAAGLAAGGRRGRISGHAPDRSEKKVRRVCGRERNAMERCVRCGFVTPRSEVSRRVLSSRRAVGCAHTDALRRAPTHIPYTGLVAPRAACGIVGGSAPLVSRYRAVCRRAREAGVRESALACCTRLGIPA